MRRSLKIWGPVGALAAVLAYSSCGENELNVYKPVAEPLALKSDPDARLEEAKVHMDKKEYDKAVDILEPMIEDEAQDSNEARMLYAAAELGQAELDVWSIISKILEDQDKSKQSRSSGGIDTVLNSIGDSVLGTGAARQAKIDALARAIGALAEAPEPDDRKIQNTSCLFAGILAVPTLADAQSGLTATLAALDQIKAQATSGGSECPNISLLDTATASVVSAAANFNLILEAADSCPFLDLAETQALMNQVESALALLKENADLASSPLPTCPASLPNCATLFPTCVQQALSVGSSAALAGDGKIASCELVLHCTDPKACFR